MIWFVLAAVLGGLRIAGVKSVIFQAIAHVYMGSLGTTWWFKRNPWLAWLFVGLSVLETVCFLVSRR